MPVTVKISRSFKQKQEMDLSWGEVERDSKPHPQLISFHGGGLYGYLVEIRSCKQTSIVPMGLPTDGNFFSRHEAFAGEFGTETTSTQKTPFFFFF